jgi:RNA polymerase sigma factor (sigma-70 family)
MQDIGERTLFDNVFLPHTADAYRLAHHLAGNPADAEDIVQEAGLRAFRGIRDFGLTNPRAWTLTIVRNTAYTLLRKNRSKTTVFTGELGFSERDDLELENLYHARVETPEEATLLRQGVEDVRNALAKLPEYFREVIVLRDINQLNNRDIAEITNSPLGTVMSRLSRGRRLLVTLLAA